jgi:deoxyadenosine/deoxycytidine kinase
MRRISRQGTALERNISEKYLQDLIEAYDYFFFNYQASPLLVVKSDELDASRDDHLDDLVAQIAGMKKTSLYYVPSSFAGAGAKKR